MDLAGSERQKDTNAVGQRLKVSEMAIHVHLCTEMAVIFFIYQVKQMVSYSEFIRKIPK